MIIPTHFFKRDWKLTVGDFIFCLQKNSLYQTKSLNKSKYKTWNKKENCSLKILEINSGSQDFRVQNSQEKRNTMKRLQHCLFATSLPKAFADLSTTRGSQAKWKMDLRVFWSSTEWYTPKLEFKATRTACN